MKRLFFYALLAVPTAAQAAPHHDNKTFCEEVGRSSQIIMELRQLGVHKMPLYKETLKIEDKELSLVLNAAVTLAWQFPYDADAVMFGQYSKNQCMQQRKPAGAK